MAKVVLFPWEMDLPAAVRARVTIRVLCFDTESRRAINSGQVMGKDFTLSRRDLVKSGT
jgi:hypothetical protein